MKEEPGDLSFVEFGGPGRPYTAPLSEEPNAESDNALNSLVGRQGLEPWTLGLKEQSGAELRRGLAPWTRQIAA